MLKAIRKYIGDFRLYSRERKQVAEAATEKRGRLSGRIVRLVHSIEKGLSIESPRPGFGYEKIKMIYAWIKEYLALDGIDKTCVYMAADAFLEYCEYHDSIGISSERIDEIKAITAELQEIKIADGITDKFGGVLRIKRGDMTFDTDTVERLFATRHSIRNFKKEPVSKELIRRAVKMAQSAPSACNRQAVRVYVTDAEKFIKDYTADLQGIGGFVDNCDKIILITGKLSAYEDYEYKQFIVSAGIFAGYLSLALHSVGLGACVVQRSIRPNPEWSDYREKNGIPIDEQLVCLLTVGNLDDETVVPLSRRFDTDTVLKWL